MVVVYVFLGLVLLRLVFIAALVALLLSVGPSCPACGGATLLVRPPRWRRRLRWLEHRWCLDCGWAGWTRRGRPNLPAHTGAPTA